MVSGRYQLRIDEQPHGHYRNEHRCMVAFHGTPGYETYRGMGWRGVIEQHGAT